MKRILVLLLLVGCGGGGHRAVAPTIDPKLDAELTPYIESYGKTWGDRHKMSGYVLVTQHDVPIYARAFGFADREHRIVADADTSFRIGSVTKQFTAAAILVLQQDGKLTTQDTIGAHLPDYPAVGAGITIHQLLSHTSGIPNYTEDAALMEARGEPHDVAALMASFDGKPLEFEPGTAFSYSNSNYIVLGAIIEQASGMPYAAFMKQRIFEPAGLARTVVGDAEGMPDRAIGYSRDGDALVAAHPIDMTVPYAAGAIRSTPNDLVRWNRALAGDRILTGASKQQLYTPVLNDYAYGWAVSEIEGHAVIGHGGGIDGFLTDYKRVEDLDLVVVVLANYDGIEVNQIGEAAVTAVLGGKLTAIDEPAPVPVDAEAAARIVGTWTLTDAGRAEAAAKGLPADVIESIATIRLRVEHDELVLAPQGQSPVALVPSSVTTYTRADIGLTVTVTLPDDGGPATGLRIEQNGLTLDFVPATP